MYDMYRQEAQAISQSGVTPKRVVLDFELKKHVNSQLAKIQRLSRVEREPRKREIARALGRSDGATKVLIHRAIKQLQEIVGDPVAEEVQDD